MNNQPVNIIEAQQDSQEIFSLLDDLIGKAGPDPVNREAPLTAAEQDKLAMFLGEPTPAYSVHPPELVSSSGLKNTNNPNLNTLGDEIEGLFFQLQQQLETVIAQHASLSQELAATRSRIETQETISKTNAPQAISPPCMANTEDIRPVLDKIAHWRTLFADQFEHLLTSAQDSMTQQQQLEAALTQANQSIQRLLSQVNTQSTVRQQNSQTISTLRAELRDQKKLVSATQAKFEVKESNRAQVEQILQKVNARLKKRPMSTVTLRLKARLKNRPMSTVTDRKFDFTAME